MSFVVENPWDEFDHVRRRANMTWKWSSVEYAMAKKEGILFKLKISIAMAYIQLKPALHTSTKCKLFILCLLYLQGHF